ncbi:MAG: lysozyme inhibitor [Oceanospirillales bacterium]|nr:lysozyme inhibitor [Oceanospirillales bacterium]
MSHTNKTEARMDIAVPGSGSRYVGSELVWWTEGSGPGSEGAVRQHMADATSGGSIELYTDT